VLNIKYQYNAERDYQFRIANPGVRKQNYTNLKRQLKPDNRVQLLTSTTNDVASPNLGRGKNVWF